MCVCSSMKTCLIRHLKGKITISCFMTDLHKANTKLTSLTRFDTLPIASSFCVASPTFLILEGNGFFSKDAFLLCAMNQNTGSLVLLWPQFLCQCFWILRNETVHTVRNCLIVVSQYFVDYHLYYKSNF